MPRLYLGYGSWVKKICPVPMYGMAEEKMSGGSVWSGKKMSGSVRSGQKNVRFGAEWAKKFPVRRGVGKKISGSARSEKIIYALERSKICIQYGVD